MKIILTASVVFFLVFLTPTPACAMSAASS